MFFSKVPLKKENGQTVLVPLFQSQENITGKVYYFFEINIFFINPYELCVFYWRLLDFNFHFSYCAFR